MSWSFFEPLIAIIFKVIEINTCLFIGLSLVGVKLSKHLIKTIIISFFAGILYFSGEKLFSGSLILIGVFILLIPTITFFLKQQALKVIVAILIALTFDLMVIKLLENNFFDILLIKSNVVMDAGIEFSLESFIALNNLFLSILIYSKLPMLFPSVLFEKQIKEDEASISFRSHVYFTIFLLLLLNIGLFLLYTELNYLRLNFRIVLTLWSIAVGISLLYFLKISIATKNERIQIYLDKQYQKDVLSFYSIIRSQRHDFNFHLTSIYGLIQNKQYDSCEEYIKGMVKDVYEVNELLSLHHPAIGAMLVTFKELAEKKNIPILYYIMDDFRKMPCSVYDMNKILGNLIQNAIDEVEMSDENASPIEVEMKNERDTLVIVVSNKANITEEQLKKIFQSGYSTKSSHEGLGLPTVKKIVSKYNGVVYPEMTGNCIRFIVSIPVSP